MNGLRGSLNALVDISIAAKHLNCTAVICPPATLVLAATQTQDIISVGGQDCHDKATGPYTGDISAAMLADSGAKYVIVGHSERRGEYGETNSLVKRKATVAQASDLTPIICVGETLDERKAGRAIEIVSRDFGKKRNVFEFYFHEIFEKHQCWSSRSPQQKPRPVPIRKIIK